MFTETPISFKCNDQQLFGILHCPEVPQQSGVLIVVGGAQYRVGSHRQFVLLARYLCNKGIPVFRFDYRGMGDSEGNLTGFENVEDDILAAIDTFYEYSENLRHVSLWGLCDAATAIAFYGHKDSRVKKLVLLNPWVRSEAGLAKAYLKTYYLGRLMSTYTWKRLVTGDLDIREGIKSVAGHIKQVFGGPWNRAKDNPVGNKKYGFQQGQQKDISSPLDKRLFYGLQHFKGPVLIILSGNDLTAEEFKNSLKENRGYRRILDRPNTNIFNIADADHTFSRRHWSEKVEKLSLEWLIEPNESQN